METNTIYNESCIETIKRLHELNSKVTVITSPPYNMNLRIRQGKYCSRQIVKEFSSKYTNFDDNLPIDDYYRFHLSIIKNLLEVSDLIFYNVCIVTGSKRAWFKIIGELNEYVKEFIIWDKGNGQPAMQQQVLNRQSELIIVFEKNNAISRQFHKGTFERGTLNDIWQVNRERSISSNNSATFPKELIRKILTNFTKENDIIYDPFIGTGTTAVVAKELNRQYIGSEIDETLYTVCLNRLKAFCNKI